MKVKLLSLLLENWVCPSYAFRHTTLLEEILTLLLAAQEIFPSRMYFVVAIKVDPKKAGKILYCLEVCIPLLCLPFDILACRQ